MGIGRGGGGRGGGRHRTVEISVFESVQSLFLLPRLELMKRGRVVGVCVCVCVCVCACACVCVCRGGGGHFF